MFLILSQNEIHMLHLWVAWISFCFYSVISVCPLYFWSYCSILKSAWVVSHLIAFCKDCLCYGWRSSEVDGSIWSCQATGKNKIFLGKSPFKRYVIITYTLKATSTTGLFIQPCKYDNHEVCLKICLLNFITVADSPFLMYLI